MAVVMAVATVEVIMVAVMAAISVVATASVMLISAAAITAAEGSRDPTRSGTEVLRAITPLPDMAERILAVRVSVKSETPLWHMATSATR
jgi:ABC-type Zn uptake system ZnuABC Zn-binding protein ZnuA